MADNGTEEKITHCILGEEFWIFQHTTDDLLLAASMASTVFNVLVIFCAIKLFKKSGDTMHLFIINMTSGDLIMTVFCTPNQLLLRKHEFLKVPSLCLITNYFNWVGLAVSGASLTLLNVDKLIYFRWPLSYDRSMSTQRALLFCVAAWVTTIGFVSYSWISAAIYIDEDCSLQITMDRKWWYETFMMMFCVLPVTSSLVVSVYLFRLTRQKRNSSIVGGTTDHHTFRNKLKSLMFIFATTTWTSFSLLPYRIFNLARLHLFSWSELSCDLQERMSWAAWILVYLLVINPIVNPFITSFIYAPYRMQIKKFFTDMHVAKRATYDTESASQRRRRGSAGHELSSLRQSTEATRVSMGDPPSKNGRRLSMGNSFSYDHHSSYT